MRFNPFANLSLKLISLFIAIFLWFIVSGGNRGVMDFRVPLQLAGLPGKLAIAGEYPDTVDVRVQAPDVILSRLSEAQINVIVDLSKVTEGEQIIPITADLVHLPGGANVVKVSPSQIKLTIEKKMARKLPVVPSVVGTPKSGFAVRRVSVSPEQVIVEGARSEVASLDQVLTTPVSVAERASSFRERVRLVVPNPRVWLLGDRYAEVSVEIGERIERRRIEGIPVKLVRSSYRASFQPEKIAVVVEGPSSLLERLRPSDFRAVVYGKGLVPLAMGYMVSPKVDIISGKKGNLRIVSIIPKEVKVTISKQ